WLVRRRRSALPMALTGFIVAEWSSRRSGRRLARIRTGFYGPATRSDGLAIGCLIAAQFLRQPVLLSGSAMFSRRGSSVRDRGVTDGAKCTGPRAGGTRLRDEIGQR